MDRLSFLAIAVVAQWSSSEQTSEVVMLRWFHRLMPKEERFFELFAQHSHAVVAGAVALRSMLEGGDAIPTQLPDGDGS